MHEGIYTVSPVQSSVLYCTVLVAFLKSGERHAIGNNMKELMQDIEIQKVPKYIPNPKRYSLKAGLMRVHSPIAPFSHIMRCNHWFFANHWFFVTKKAWIWKNLRRSKTCFLGAMCLYSTISRIATPQHLRNLPGRATQEVFLLLESCEASPQYRCTAV